MIKDSSAQAPIQMEQREVTWNPGFLKLFDEIITNSVDHSKRPEGKHLDTIKVEINRETGEISVYDNGGIPVVMLEEYEEYLPTTLFGYLRSGTNFDDDEEEENTGAGQNGEGASLANVFSTRFVVETCDGHKRFKQVWTDGMTKPEAPKVSDSDGKGFTRITYLPDYAHLGTQLDDDNYATLVKRVVDVAGCNPRLKVYLNGNRVNVKSFKDYIEFYTSEYEYEENEDWQIGVAKSEDGFQHVSFVNSTNTLIGGTHIAYSAYAIANRLREFFNKKHKVDVKPTDILAHMQLFVNVRIDRPRYDSQTKENLMTEVKEYKTKLWEPSEKFIQKLSKSEVVARVLDWIEAKKAAEQAAAARRAGKDADKLNLRRILKLQDANLAGKEPEKCILFLTEGKSAAKAGKSTGDRATMGFLELRGVPLNVNGADMERILGKKKKDGSERPEGSEFFQLMAAMGLKIGTKVTSIKDLRYGMIGIMTDADHDGAGHITGLLINNLYKFWPELFELGVVHRFVTPIVKVRLKTQKAPIAFYEEHEFNSWKNEHAHLVAGKDFKMKYYKGLATSTEDEFGEYLENINDHLIQLTMEDSSDSEVIDLVFGKTSGAADRRKAWLNLTAD
jgi:DNA topoisomerase-2